MQQEVASVGINAGAFVISAGGLLSRGVQPACSFAISNTPCGRSRPQLFQRSGISMQADKDTHVRATSRRRLLLSALISTAALFSVVDQSALAGESASIFALQPTSDSARPFLVIATQEKKILDELAKKDVVFLGEHHNKAADHDLQASIIAGIAARRGPENVAIGLEMVQQPFQAALDTYVAGEIKDDTEAEQALYDGVRWAELWQWPFSDYLPVFRLARNEKIPLVALNVDSAAMAKVRVGGFEGLPKSDRDRYVDDKQGFIAFARTPGFVDYVEKIIMPSYEFHARMGLLGAKPSQANFYSSRILWDEGMSNQARKFLASSKKTIVVLEGADHVKYGLGSVGRMKRLAPSFEVASVLLNPTPSDTLDTPTSPLALQMQYSQGALKLADFLWFSAPPSNSLLPPSLRLS